MPRKNSSQDFNHSAANKKQAAEQAFKSHTKGGLLAGLGTGVLMSLFLVPALLPAPTEDVKNSPSKMQRYEEAKNKITFGIGIGLTLISMGLGGGVGMTLGVRKAGKIMHNTPKP